MHFLGFVPLPAPSPERKLPLRVVMASRDSRAHLRCFSHPVTLTREPSHRTAEKTKEEIVLRITSYGLLLGRRHFSGASLTTVPGTGLSGFLSVP